MKKLIVGMTGASGSIFGIRLLEVLRETDVEVHLVVSKWAQQTLEHEVDTTLEEVRALADKTYGPGDMGAAISSGSFVTDGMIIVPCSTRPVAAIAGGLGDHLVHRAADVVLKERRPLVLVVRETPLSDIHLENMLKLSRLGVCIMPPNPGFYFRPQTLEDVVDFVVARILDQASIKHQLMPRWGE